MGNLGVIDIGGGGNMMFENPDFRDGSIEFRLTRNNGGDQEICIYLTDEGVVRLISLLQELKNRKNSDHIHLEDYEILTKKSLKGVIALIRGIS